MRLLYIYFIVAILIAVQVDLSAQYIPTPLGPAKDKVPGYIGFIVGFGQNYQTGEFYVDCPDCIFENAVGTGFTLGASYDRVALPWLKYGIALFYDYSGIKSSFLETELIPFELQNSGLKEDIPVEFRHTANVDFHNLIAMPYVKIEPVDFFFIRLGFGLSYIFSSKIKHDKELLQKVATLSNGATVSIRIPGIDGYKVNIQDSQVSDLNNLQLYLMPAIGFKLNISTTTYLKPYFQFNLPLSDISGYGKDYRINEWRIFLELGFKAH